MTLNLTQREMRALNELADHKGLSKTAILRQALRLYEALDQRVKNGGRVMVEHGDEQRSELMLL